VQIRVVKVFSLPWDICGELSSNEAALAAPTARANHLGLLGSEEMHRDASLISASMNALS
jgi:hypothetical protein